MAVCEHAWLTGTSVMDKARMMQSPHQSPHYPWLYWNSVLEGEKGRFMVHFSVLLWHLVFPWVILSHSKKKKSLYHYKKPTMINVSQIPSPSSDIWRRALDVFKNRAGTRQVSAHLESQLLGRLKWGEWGDEERKPHEFKRQGGFKGEVQKRKCWNWKRKPNARVSVPIRACTDLTGYGWQCSLLVFSALLWSGRIPSDVIPSDTITSEKVLSLLPNTAVSAQHRAAPPEAPHLLPRSA